jgi:hypothetical protein
MRQLVIVLGAFAFAAAVQATPAGPPQSSPNGPRSEREEVSCPARYHEALAAAKRALQSGNRDEALAQLRRAQAVLDTCEPDTRPIEVVDAG